MDSRFTSAGDAPIFKKVRSSSHKTKLDPRFSGVLSDERFQLNPGEVDKYGRKTKKKDKREAALNELQQIYEIDEDLHAATVGPSSSAKKERKYEEREGKGKGKGKGEGKGEGKGKAPKAMESRLDYLNKLSRGEISESSSESSDDSSDSVSVDATDDDDSQVRVKKLKGDEEDEDEEEEIEMAEGAETHIIALQNCDWDHMKATDIL